MEGNGDDTLNNWFRIVGCLSDRYSNPGTVEYEGVANQWTSAFSTSTLIKLQIIIVPKESIDLLVTSFTATLFQVVLNHSIDISKSIKNLHPDTPLTNWKRLFSDLQSSFKSLGNLWIVTAGHRAVVVRYWVNVVVWFACSTISI